MAADKKNPPKKPAVKKTTAKPGARKRQASRPPTIELKADEFIDQSKPDTGGEKPSKNSEADAKAQKSASEASRSESPQDKSPAQPSSGKGKGSLIAAGLVGLLAGSVGGLLSGFVLSDSPVEQSQNQDFAGLQKRVEKIETGQNTSATSSEVTTRLEKAESDTRFLNAQLATLQKDIANLKSQLTLFSGKFSTKNDGPDQNVQPPIDISTLENKIANLQDQIDKRANKASELNSQLENLQKTIDAQKSVQKKSQQKAEAVIQETVQAYSQLQKSVDEKIRRLYQAGGDNRIRAAALSLSLRHLTEATEGSNPFSKELEAVGALIGEQKSIKELIPYAASGVPDLTALKLSFAGINLGSVQKKPSTSDGSLLDKILSNAKSVVKVSKISEAPSAAQNPLVSINRNLTAGDLQGVIKSSEQLEPEMKEKLQSWLDQVQKRLRVKGLMSELKNLILAEIGKSTSTTPNPKKQSGIKLSPDTHSVAPPQPVEKPEQTSEGASGKSSESREDTQ